MIGPNSPATPAASVNGPSGVSSSPASRRIGISVPIAVVESATPINSVETTKPVACRTPAMPRASASEKSQPHTASFAGRPRIWRKSISMPARKKRNARPTELRKTTSASACDEVEHVRADDDAREDLDDDDRNAHAPRDVDDAAATAAAMTATTSRLKSSESMLAVSGVRHHDSRRAREDPSLP